MPNKVKSDLKRHRFSWPLQVKEFLDFTENDRKFKIFNLGYISYVFLFMVGYFRELIWGTGPLGRAKPITEKNRSGYTTLYASFESFYTRNVYR